MKLYDKILLILILFTTNFLISQAPSQFTYQSVVRANSGSLVSNQEVSFRFTILKGTELGSIVFEEEHTVTTNINGLATMIIGKGSGTDDLLEIDWGIDSYFLKVEVDPEGGFNYIAEDTTQLLSVPFALYSNSSGSNLKITGQDYLSINNNEINVNKIDLSDDVDGILPIANGGTGSSTAPMVGIITAEDAESSRTVLGLGTAATTASTDFALSSNNSSDVTLSGLYDYLTLVGQTITVDLITNDDLAGSIANDKLSNSTVSYGGISLALGGTDATPAFDLADATNYPTTSLSGTITNAQLAGSIDLTSKVANTLPVSNGGTGGTTTLSARTSLGIIAGILTLDGSTSSPSTSDIGVDENYSVNVNWSINNGVRSIETVVSNADGTITINLNATPNNGDKIYFIAIDTN